MWIPCSSPAHPSPLRGGGYQRRMTVSSTYSTHSNTTPSPPPAEQNCSSVTQILGPIASRALSLYCECLVHRTPAKFVLQTKRGRQQLSFTCRDIPAGSTAVSKNLSRRRPANPRRLEKKRISSLQPGTLSTFQPKQFTPLRLRLWFYKD